MKFPNDNERHDSRALGARAPSARIRRSRGFSLIEMILTITIVSILAAVMIPLFGPQIPSQLEAAAAIVATDVDFASSLAVANGSSYRLTFAPASNQFYLKYAGANSLLNTLPPSAFGRGDPADRRTTNLDDLPVVSPRVLFLGAESPPGSGTRIATLDFTALGGTTASQDTQLWLQCGSGAAARYQAIRINAATGLTEIGALTGSNPNLR